MGPSLLQKKILSYFVLFVYLFLSVKFGVPHSSSLNMVESHSTRVDIGRNVEKNFKELRKIHCDFPHLGDNFYPLTSIEEGEMLLHLTY